MDRQQRVRRRLAHPTRRRRAGACGAAADPESAGRPAGGAGVVAVLKPTQIDSEGPACARQSIESGLRRRGAAPASPPAAECVGAEVKMAATRVEGSGQATSARLAGPPGKRRADALRGGMRIKADARGIGACT